MCRTVEEDEIAANEYNLNISLYVDTTEPEKKIDVAAELQTLRELQEERDAIETRITQYMEVLNYE
jgi:type I restriction enzyme M protein